MDRRRSFRYLFGSSVLPPFNAGSTLARETAGPVQEQQEIRKRHRLAEFPAIALPAKCKRARLELVAFVQGERSRDVLQALSANQCAGS